MGKGLLRCFMVALIMILVLFFGAGAIIESLIWATRTGGTPLDDVWDKFAGAESGNVWPTTLGDPYPVRTLIGFGANLLLAQADRAQVAVFVKQAQRPGPQLQGFRK